MMLKEYLLQFVKIACLIALLSVAHMTLHMLAAPRLAGVLAKPYAPLTQEEALAQQKAAGRDNSCWSSSYAYQRMCEAGLLTSEKNSTSNSSDLSYEHALHKNEYQDEVLQPLADQIQTYIMAIFCLFYVIAILRIVVIIRGWFLAQEKPSISHLLGRISWLPAVLKECAAQRALRNAEKELNTLISLHQNGLITEDAFNKRKDALRMIIGNNHLLQ